MNGQSYHSTELLVNSNVLGVTHFNSGNVMDGSASDTVVVHVDQGDDVLLRTAEGNNAGNVISNYAGRSFFAGWILI